MRRHRHFDPTQGQKPMTPETERKITSERKEKPDLAKSTRMMAAAAKQGASRSQFRRRAK